MLIQNLILFFLTLTLGYCEVIKLGFGSCLFQGDSMQILSTVKKEKTKILYFFRG